MNKKYTRTLAENNKFRFYCTCSPEMLLKGIDVELDEFSDQNECKKQLIIKLKSSIQNINQFDLLLYLPGGVPFFKGKLNDIFSNEVKPEVKQNIYGVLTRPIQNEDLDKKYTRLSDISKNQKKLLFSPIYESTNNGLCDIACILEYCKQNGKFCSKFQNILSSIIPFPPFSTCLRQFVENNSFTGRDIITITSALHTYFSHLIKMSKPPQQIFESTLKLCNIIINNEEPQNPPIQEININEYILKGDDYWPLTVFDRPNESFQFWRGDLVGTEDDFYELDQINIDEIGDDEKNIFSSNISHGISIIRGKDHCYLCFNESELSKSQYIVVDPITNSVNKVGSFEELIHSKYCIELKNNTRI